MPVRATTLQQCEIRDGPRSAIAHHYSLTDLAELQADFHAAVSSEETYVVGLSVELAKKGACVRTLVLALRDQVFCLSLGQRLNVKQRQVLQELFSNIHYLAGFEMPYTIIVLAHSLGFNISGYDLTTTTVPGRTKLRGSRTPGGIWNTINPSVNARRVDKRWDGVITRGKWNASGTPRPNYATRAWFTAMAAEKALSFMTLKPPLSTGFVTKPMLRLLVDLATRAIRIDLAKPRIKENDFAKVDTNHDGGIDIINARFKTRIRKSEQCHLEVHLANGDTVKASIKGVQGRLSSATPEGCFLADVSRIRVIGREEPTNAEQAQYCFLVLSLNSPRKVPLFVNIIWFPKNNRAGGCDEKDDLSCGHAFRVLETLNDSQKEVVAAMVSTAPCDSLVIAHGPPGTGKTTTIAAAASIWVDNRSPCWIIAQSNVGVKNIAETLFKRNVKFKLIVSKDFFFEWHEHLYKGIEKTLIRSDELPSLEVPKAFDGIKLVLSTLTMLSNPEVENCGLLRFIPVKSLVIDEASQIDVFEFMHLFYKFSKVLTKVCFFGDPKQLPPYGADTAELQTIFDIKHLEKRAYFLDTQYRLPVPLGEFISERVYSGKLRSCHKIVDYSCIKFIDVQKGNEKKKGSSYENMEEVHMVVRTARRYHQRGLEFCVITFYDPQRAAIIKALETEKLPSGCVFNVDSFQGNEADYVILSSVRTQKPGFLKSEPRMNVALTRCRKGMVIVTNKCFLQGVGKSTLLGKLNRDWSQHRDSWIDWKAMLNDSGPVELPGVLSLPPPLQLPQRTLEGLKVDSAVQTSDIE